MPFASSVGTGSGHSSTRVAGLVALANGVGAKGDVPVTTPLRTFQLRLTISL